MFFWSLLYAQQHRNKEASREQMRLLGQHHFPPGASLTSLRNRSIVFPGHFVISLSSPCPCVFRILKGGTERLWVKCAGVWFRAPSFKGRLWKHPLCLPLPGDYQDCRVGVFHHNEPWTVEAVQGPWTLSDAIPEILTGPDRKLFPKQ